VIRKEMVAKFAQLPQSQKVMFSRKAIKNYRSRVCHLQKVQVKSAGAPVKAGEGSKWKGEQGDVGKSRKAPRTQAQAAVMLEKERKQSTGSKVLSSMGVHTSGQGTGLSQECAILGIEEEGESHWSKMG
jgi:predicted secreted protein